MVQTDSLKFVFITPTGILYDQPISQITVSTEAGPVTILPNHDTLVSILKPGELVINENGKEFALVVAGGILEMTDNKLVILAEEAEHAAQIDVKAAQDAAAALAKRLEEEVEIDVTTYENLVRMLDYHSARVLVGRKWNPRAHKAQEEGNPLD